MTKKSKIILAIAVFSFSAIAYAWVPLAIRAGQAVMRAAGSQTATNLGYATLFGSSAALIGQQTGLFELTRQNSAGDDITMRMPLTDLPRDRPQAVPPAGTPTQTVLLNPPTQNSQYVCPAGSTSQGGSTQNQCTYTLTTSFVKNASNPQWCDRIYQFTPIDDTGCPGGNNYGGVNEMYSQGVLGCASGYTYGSGTCTRNPETPACSNGYTDSSGQCVLTEPEKIPDKNCDLQSNGSGFITMPTDADCAAVWDAQEAAQIAEQNGLLSAYAAAFQMAHPENGTPQDVLMQIYPASSSGGYSGSCPYQVCIPIPSLPGHYRIAGLTSTGDGTTKYTAIDVNSSGVVDSVRSGTIAGTLAGAGTTYTNAAGQTAVVQPGQAVLVNPSTTGALVQAPAVQTPAINFPSDYARSGEASNAADKIVNKLDEPADMTDMSTPEIPANPLVAALSPWNEWRPPVVVGTCPSGSFAVFDTTYNFDVACQLLEQKAAVIQTAMYLFFVIVAIFILLSA